MSERPRVWVLNLDAEEELESPRGYQPTQHLRRIVAAKSELLLGALVAPGDIVLDEGAAPERVERARGLPGIAWSPTPRALARLRAAGAVPEPAPELDILRAVNARPFAALVREPLAGASFAKTVVLTLEEACERLARPAHLGWLVRRTFGAAGRSRRRLPTGRPTGADELWLRASLRRGPLVIEPWVEIVREHTRSAHVDRSGRVTISAPCFQATDGRGAWTHTELAEAGALRDEDDQRLEEAVQQAGQALARVGYFGPFGIDAFRHRAPDGSRRTILNPLSEINARYTMDWATAFGLAAEPYVFPPRSS